MAECRVSSQVNAGAAGPRETIVFAPFCLDLRAGRLLRGSQPVPLRPKTFAVLRHLAEHPGALVTKDELLDVVWADTTVTESTLSKSIGELRRASRTTPRRRDSSKLFTTEGFVSSPRSAAACQVPRASPHLLPQPQTLSPSDVLPSSSS